MPNGLVNAQARIFMAFLSGTDFMYSVEENTHWAVSEAVVSVGSRLAVGFL